MLIYSFFREVTIDFNDQCLTSLRYFLLRGVNKAERCGAKAQHQGTSRGEACDEIKTGLYQESPNARCNPREKGGLGDWYST